MRLSAVQFRILIGGALVKVVVEVVCCAASTTAFMGEGLAETVVNDSSSSSLESISEDDRIEGEARGSRGVEVCDAHRSGGIDPIFHGAMLVFGKSAIAVIILIILVSIFSNTRNCPDATEAPTTPTGEREASGIWSLQREFLTRFYTGELGRGMLDAKFVDVAITGNSYGIKVTWRERELPRLRYEVLRPTIVDMPVPLSYLQLGHVCTVFKREKSKYAGSPHSMDRCNWWEA
jgi:hypothetical protein